MDNNTNNSGVVCTKLCTRKAGHMITDQLKRLLEIAKKRDNNMQNVMDIIEAQSKIIERLSEACEKYCSHKQSLVMTDDPIHRIQFLDIEHTPAGEAIIFANEQLDKILEQK